MPHARALIRTPASVFSEVQQEPEGVLRATRATGMLAPRSSQRPLGRDSGGPPETALYARAAVGKKNATHAWMYAQRQLDEVRSDA